MARRSDNTRKELKEMAIEAAIMLLEESGVEQLSARKIAARIGYTVGTLYNVFTDYEDIILHVNSRTLHDMQAQLEPLAYAKKKSQQRIQAFAHCYGDYAMAHPARWNLLHNSPRSTPLPGWFRNEIHAVFSLVEEPLVELCVHRPEEAANAAKVLWAGLHGICSLSISQKLDAVKAGPMQELMDNFIRNYLNGLSN